MTTIVTGASGFIGSHLMRRLADEGEPLRGIDLVGSPLNDPAGAALQVADLRDPWAARTALQGADRVFALAANMGGIGWTHAQPAAIMRDNLLISTNTIEAAREAGCRQVIFASSACVYPGYLQEEPNARPLAEEPVWPADPDMQYGWEKLTAEILYRTFAEAFGMDVRTARLHAIYGPFGTFDGPRAKSLSMLCAKVAALPPGGGEIDVWGDGTQTRSYCYIDDCVEGLMRLSGAPGAAAARPVNIGSQERVSIAELVDRIAEVAGKMVVARYDTNRPVGPRGRCSDNTFVRELLGWAPSTPLTTGLRRTYWWIEEQADPVRHVLGSS